MRMKDLHSINNNNGDLVNTQISCFHNINYGELVKRDKFYSKSAIWSLFDWATLPSVKNIDNFYNCFKFIENMKRKFLE